MSGRDMPISINTIMILLEPLQMKTLPKCLRLIVVWQGQISLHLPLQKFCKIAWRIIPGHLTRGAADMLLGMLLTTLSSLATLCGLSVMDSLTGGAFFATVTHVIPDVRKFGHLSVFFATLKRTVAKNMTQGAFFATVNACFLRLPYRRRKHSPKRVFCDGKCAFIATAL